MAEDGYMLMIWAVTKYGEGRHLDSIAPAEQVKYRKVWNLFLVRNWVDRVIGELCGFSDLRSGVDVDQNIDSFALSKDISYTTVSPLDQLCWDFGDFVVFNP